MSVAEPRTLFSSIVSAEAHLSRRFWSAVALVMACSLALGLTLISGYLHQLTTSSDKLSRLMDLQIVLDAANRISAERGPANGVLGTPLASISPALRRLQQARDDSDKALAQVAAIAELSQSTIVTERILAAARAKIDAVARQSFEMRSTTESQAAIEAMFGAYDSAQRLVDAAMTQLLDDEHVPGLTGKVLVARMLSELREHAGRLGSHVFVAIAQGQPLGPRRRAAFEATRGRVLELWLLIRQQTASSEAPAVQAAHKAVMERFFGDGMSLLGRMFAAGETGHFDIGQAAFTTEIVATLLPLEQLREAYLNTAVAKLNANRCSASRALWVVAIGTAVLIVIEFLLLVASQKLLFRPLLIARSRIVALANRKVGEPLANSAARGEMRDLFNALDVLRGHLIERDALDQERAALTATLRRQADLDGLTGILNRGALERVAADLMTSPRSAPARIGLILLDLDHFKCINDNFGHTVGDQILKGVAEILRLAVRNNDVVARFGGEEFAVLLLDPEGEAPIEIAERLRRAIGSERFGLGLDKHLSVTASFGVAATEKRAGAWPELVANADRALYAAKAAGRNCVISDRICA